VSRAFSREGSGSRKENASKRKNEAVAARLFRHRQMIYQLVRIGGDFGPQPKQTNKQL
jgi:hypothetical protein